MRICITRSERSSYSETFIRDQIDGFVKRAEVYTIHSGRLPERTEEGRLLNPWLFWVLGKVVRGITGNRNNFFNHYGLKRFFRQNKIEVVLANYGISAAHIMPVCRSLNIPLLVSIHGHDATDQKLLQQYAKRYKALFAYASTVIVGSTEMEKKILALGADVNKVSLVPCGIDLTRFSPSHQAARRTFVAVGRFVPKKAPHLTIQAFHTVWKKHPDAKLVMIGAKNGLYDECIKLVDSLGMSDAVIFTGIRTPEEVSAYMKQALAFVQHSVVAPNGDMEGTAISILEAGASGLPVVSTFHSGIKDSVIHTKTGFLVEEGDVAGMANYMMQLLEDPTLAKIMGEAARERIQTHYDQNKQHDRLYELALQAVNRTA